ncbi:MAG TPA: lysophospholipid acyltransferase family protein [Treponemataceae bacterium]|nr:lysophospholipid acyltransferase family protein [Treponemataceae bacterium]
MLRTALAVVRFSFYLIWNIPALRVARRLEREGKTEELDRAVDARVQDWGQFVVGLAGGTVEVSGEENVPTGPCVFIGNHQGNLDIPIMLGYIKKPKAFISKIEILKVPFLSDWMRLMRCTFLDRRDMRQSVRAMQEAVDTVRGGLSLVIFPEGTRSRGGPIGEFKAGSFKLALKAEVPIVPVTIDGSWRLFEENGRVRSGHVRVTVHPPIPTAGLSREEAAALPERVRTVVASALGAQATA